MSRALLSLNGLAFTGTAIWVGAVPERASAALGFTTWGAAGGQEFLANFLGLYGAVGLYLVVCGWSRREVLKQGGVLQLTVLLTGLAAGRLVSWISGFGGTPMQFAFLLWEGTMAFLCWRQVRRGSLGRRINDAFPTP